MSIARGGHVDFTSSGGSQNKSLSLSVTAGDLVFAFWAGAVARTPTVTLDGVSMTHLVTTGTINFGASKGWVFVGVAGSTGTSTVAFDAGASGTYQCLCFGYGAASSTIPTPASGSISSGTAIAAGLTTATDEAWVVTLVIATKIQSAVSGCTAFGTPTTTGGVYDSGPKTPVGAVAQSIALGSSGSAAWVSVEIDPSGGGGGGVPLLLILRGMQE